MLGIDSISIFGDNKYHWIRKWPIQSPSFVSKTLGVLEWKLYSAPFIISLLHTFQDLSIMKRNIYQRKVSSLMNVICTFRNFLKNSLLMKVWNFWKSLCSFCLYCRYDILLSFFFGKVVGLSCDESLYVVVWLCLSFFRLLTNLNP